MAAIYGTIGTQPRLLVSKPYFGINIYPLGGNSCPAPEFVEHKSLTTTLQTIDTSGDGRPELALTSIGAYELNAIGASTEIRGDANLDGVVSDTDIDVLVAYLLAGGPGAPPGADVNADGRIALDDVFYLINYRRGTGSAPPP